MPPLPTKRCTVAIVTDYEMQGLNGLDLQLVCRDSMVEGP
jgi:hypothetical protein